MESGSQKRSKKNCDDDDDDDDDDDEKEEEEEERTRSGDLCADIGYVFLIDVEHNILDGILRVLLDLLDQAVEHRGGDVLV